MLITKDTTSRFKAALLDREASGTLRQLRRVTPISGVEIALSGRRAINFASNDYLGLSGHPELKARAIEYVERYGAGSPSSRLVSGNLDIYEPLENKLAELKGAQSALIFCSGYQLNSTVIPSLFGSESVIAIDRLAHRSMLEGAQQSNGVWFRYAHDDAGDLSTKLTSERFQSKSERWVVSESVFSMDGDIADLDSLARVCRQTNAGLYVDEAHATGVFGEAGMGLTLKEHQVDLAVGTFGKGLGVFGGYIACSRVVRDYLINFCPGLIYSTALPPAVLGAIAAALDLLPYMERERRLLLERAAELRSKLAKLGFETGASATQIIPVIVGSDENALKLSQFLEMNGVFAPAIRQPTVPPGLARVRLSLSLLHSGEHVEYLLSLLRRWNGQTS